MAKSNNSGSYWDKLLLSDDELKRNEDLRGAAERGEISWEDAHSYVESRPRRRRSCFRFRGKNC